MINPTIEQIAERLVTSIRAGLVAAIASNALPYRGDEWLDGMAGHLGNNAAYAVDVLLNGDVAEEIATATFGSKR
jgi:hypothetical protein